MRRNINSLLGVLFSAAILSSCSDNHDGPQELRSEMTFTFSHPSQTRATDTAFEQGDQVGLYLVNDGNTFEISGNHLNNERITFAGSGWNSDRKLYWDQGTYNAYAYFPRLDDITSVTDLPFSVATDQRGGTEGYEASDFLHASALGLTASANPVALQFRHIMSKLTIRLIKGEDYEGEIPEKATVYLHNTVTDATVDLKAGVATRDMRSRGTTITARQSGTTTYTAIVVPQRLENRVPLVEVVMNGVSFLYESKFIFKPGIHHVVNLVVDKNPEQVKIEIGGELTNWD